VLTDRYARQRLLGGGWRWRCEFCDPALDKQAARAAVLQTTDPLAADALWARLDRELTDLAIWLPTVTPNETDLISHRIGNYQYNPVWGALIDQMWIR
jgi:hypothetical protein